MSRPMSLEVAMMTLEELELLLLKPCWFEHLGEPLMESKCVQISGLAPWSNAHTGDASLEKIADEMEWLPSSRDQDDPIHGNSLEVRSEQLGKKNEFYRQSLSVYKKALSSLRSFEGHPALTVGPHNFTEAARGAALFASRRAVYEILLDDCGFWCLVMNIYHQGHWPCGILPDTSIVVL